MALTGPRELLATWEAGLDRDAAGRALLLHRAARPEATADALLAVPVGRRAADLFGLRRVLFGERMQVRVECGRCAEAMEFDLDAAQFAAPAADTAADDGVLRVADGGWVVDFRLPTVADLAAVARALDAPSAALAPPDPQQLLLARCTVSATRDGEPLPADALPGALPEKVRHRLAEEAERADPTAEITLSIACPECGEATPAELDIADYLWTELDAWARDVLLDVHLLATAYGWSEPEILALSPQRRRYYLELCADA
ncbi:T4 family baseplate hub assembly chaperone [Streptomyces pinistramenti]|uniref:T4 family baseplate hub assembly chaperone n=1 Tax=Streptomyces pinistramenti TaxID=2884812 RepID=UPI001D0741AE|nr:hypothetical protein [Streptomyces pinistramenti]MCB5912382.1 hypothetical protein [Streptomyces pinistramenti]